MTFDLSRLRDGERQHVDRHYVPGEVDTRDDEYTVAGAVDLSFDIERSGDRFRLTGRVAAGLELACSRCLEPFTWPVDLTFDLRYLPQSENVGDDDAEVEADDLQTAFYERAGIDLGHLLREQFYLALPMKPLCRPTCQGLCPVCGTNFNVATCQCSRRWDDPRLAPLTRLGPGGPGD
jgi:uncharacterized protein